MAENTRLSLGVGGDLIRTEDIDGAYKIAVSKIYIGSQGVDGGPVTSLNPLPTSIVGPVSVTGAVSVPGTVTVAGSVNVPNTVTVGGDVSVSNIVAVSGTVTVPNTVAVSGTVNVPNTVTVSGSVNVPNTVTVSGSVNVPNTVTVSGSVNVPNTVTVSGSVNVPNTVTVSGSVNVPNTVTVSGSVNVPNTVNVSGTVGVSGVADVQGSVQARQTTGEVYNGAVALVPKRAAISVSANGLNIVVAGVPGKQIRVMQYLLVASSAVSVEFRSGASMLLTGAMALAANSGVAASISSLGHFDTAAGADLGLQLSSAVGVAGHLSYLEV